MEIDITKLTPDVRNLNDMREVLQDPEFTKTAENSPMYFMYRKVTQENGINHSVTVLPAKMLGQEFMKTKGHVHIGAYQEVYTVLEGEAIYLGQKTKGNVVEDVVAIKAKKGESFIISSGYGHVMINPSKTDTLKTGDWSSEDCRSDYSLFEKLRGACYYYLESGWVKNPNYTDIPELRFEEPLKSLPENLEFLKQG